MEKRTFKVSDLVGYYTLRALEGAPWGYTQSWDKLLQDLGETKLEFVPGLAMAIRNYMIVIAAGEMRHAGESSSRINSGYGLSGLHYLTDFPPHSTPSGEDQYLVHYNKVIGGGYDMVKLCQAMAQVFNEGNWAGSMGGPRWGQIASHPAELTDEILTKTTAQVGAAYKQTCTWMEVAVGIVHNGGSLFSKHSVPSYILGLDWDTPYIKKFLDWKFEVEDLVKVIHNSSRWQYVHPSVRQLVHRWNNLSGHPIDAMLGVELMPVTEPIVWGSAVPTIAEAWPKPVVSETPIAINPQPQFVSDKPVEIHPKPEPHVVVKSKPPKQEFVVQFKPELPPEPLPVKPVYEINANLTPLHEALDKLAKKIGTPPPVVMAGTPHEPPKEFPPGTVKIGTMGTSQITLSTEGLQLTNGFAKKLLASDTLEFLKNVAVPALIIEWAQTGANQ